MPSVGRGHEQCDCAAMEMEVVIGIWTNVGVCVALRYEVNPYMCGLVHIVW